MAVFNTSQVQSSGGTVTANINGGRTPDILNVAMASASTEYSAVLPAATVKFAIKLRGSAKLQLAYTATESGTTYITVPKGNVYGESSLSLSGALTLYFQSDSASQTAEIVYWTST